MADDELVYEIDAVITWVDSSDKDWQKQLNDNINKYLCTDASKREKCLEYNLKDYTCILHWNGILKNNFGVIQRLGVTFYIGMMP